MLSDAELIERFRGHALSRDNAAHFRGRLDRRLLIDRCDGCGVWHHPPAPVCPACWSMSITPTQVAGTGTIHLVIVLQQHAPIPGVGDASPYPVVTVELDEQPGLRFTGTVVGAGLDEVVIGRRVQLDWIDRDGEPVPVFRLVGESA
jgi:uncharacterized OB-fold protein